LKRIEADQEDPKAYSTAQLLFETATLRSGYALQDQVGFAQRIEDVSPFLYDTTKRSKERKTIINCNYLDSPPNSRLEP
jgi:hypothetical protein